MCKRYAAVILAILICLNVGVIPAQAAGFSDVPSNAWYAQDVNDVQEAGILKGVGDGKFNPTGNMTLAEAIVLASRTYAMLHQEEISNTNDNPWYWGYLQYADQKGICRNAEFGTSYNLYCNRLTMAYLFSRVIPEDTLDERNVIETIPDVMNVKENSGIYLLYRLGVLAGNDQYGYFQPYQKVTRAEVAAILNRVIHAEKRKSFSLVPVPPVEGTYNCVSWIDSSWNCGPLEWGPWGERFVLSKDGKATLFETESDGTVTSYPAKYTVSGSKSITISGNDIKTFTGTVYGDLLRLTSHDGMVSSTFARQGSKEELTISEEAYKNYQKWRPTPSYDAAIEQTVNYFSDRIDGDYGYYMEDLNGDGVKELFVGLLDYPGCILSMYTMQNGHAVCVAMGDNSLTIDDDALEATVLFRCGNGMMGKYYVNAWGVERMGAYKLSGTKLIKQNKKITINDMKPLAFYPW